MSRLKVQLKTAVHCQKNKRINPQEADLLGTSILCLEKPQIKSSGHLTAARLRKKRIEEKHVIKTLQSNQRLPMISQTHGKQDNIL